MQARAVCRCVTAISVKLPTISFSQKNKIFQSNSLVALALTRRQQHYFVPRQLFVIHG